MDNSQEAIEEVVSRIWKELLSVGQVGPGDNVLLLGGECLQATQAAARPSDVFGLEVPSRSILVGAVAEIANELAIALQSELN